MRLAAAPICSANSQTFNNCSCDIFASNYRCACNNGTQTKNVITVQNITSEVLNKATGKNQTVTTGK
jgi:hypothetical protein